MSVSTTSICWAMKAGSTGTTPCTPSVFWAVSAVMAVAAKPPMRGDRLDVGLDARAAAGIGAGDDQDAAFHAAAFSAAGSPR